MKQPIDFFDEVFGTATIVESSIHSISTKALILVAMNNYAHYVAGQQREADSNIANEGREDGCDARDIRDRINLNDLIIEPINIR